MGNIIELKSVFKITEATVVPTWDSTRNMFLGIPSISEDDKKKYSYPVPTPDDRYVIKDGTTFNLDNEAEAAIWEWVRHSPHVTDDISSSDIHGTVSRYGDAEFYVNKPDEFVEKKLQRKDVLRKVYNNIYESSPEKIKNIARVIGYPVIGKSNPEIQEALLDMADKNPEKVQKVFESADLGNMILLRDAIDTGNISHKGGVYYYGTNSIGTTMQQALFWISSKENKEQVNILKATLNPEAAAIINSMDIPDIVPSNTTETKPSTRKGQVKK